MRNRTLSNEELVSIQEYYERGHSWEEVSMKLCISGHYIDKAPLLERRAPQVTIGKDETYGMGLMVNTKYGTPVVHHGGDLVERHPAAGVVGARQRERRMDARNRATDEEVATGRRARPRSQTRRAPRLPIQRELRRPASAQPADARLTGVVSSWNKQ